MHTGELTVVLLNWNAMGETCDCLRRLVAWTQIRPHIYVVDNNSTDNSVNAISSEFPTVELLLNEDNTGFSGGNNIAFKEISARLPDNSIFDSSHFILLLNNDAFIEEEDLIVLVESFAANPKVGVTGPLLFNGHDFDELLSAGGLDPSENGRTYWAGKEAEEYIARTGTPYAVDYVSGTVALLRGQVLLEVGFFDDDYFFSCEMADLCERIKRKGYLCTINPQVRAWHDMHSSGKYRDTLYLYYSLRNRFLFIRKFRRDKLYRLFCYWIVIGGKGMLKALLTGKLATVRAYALALYDGVLGRYGGKNKLFLDSV